MKEPFKNKGYCVSSDNFKNGVVLTIYQTEGKLTKMLLSWVLFMNNWSIDQSHKKNLPNVINDYNKYKVGVDCVDSMTRLYSSKAQTRRWPVHVFFNILNIAVINSWVLYKEVNNSNIPRRNFIVQLVEELLEQTESFCISQSTQSNAQSSTPRTPTVRKRLASIDMNSAKSPPPKKTCSNDDKKVSD